MLFRSNATGSALPNVTAPLKRKGDAGRKARDFSFEYYETFLTPSTNELSETKEKQIKEKKWKMKRSNAS